MSSPQAAPTVDATAAADELPAPSKAVRHCSLIAVLTLAAAAIAMVSYAPSTSAEATSSTPPLLLDAITAEPAAQPSAALGTAGADSPPWSEVAASGAFATIAPQPVVLAPGSTAEPQWFLRGSVAPDAAATVVVVEAHSFVQGKDSRSAPIQPMPGTRDETAYINRIPIGSSFVLPANTSDRGRRLRIVLGILASPATLRKRVLPQLLTSLRYEESVVFLERNDSAPAQLAAFRECQAFLAQHPELNATAVLLDPIANMVQSIRNAWMDLPVLRHLWDFYPGREWYSIVDDDTYAFMPTVRQVLVQYDAAQPLAVGETIRWGEQGGFRLVRMRDGSRRFVQSTKRQPQTFVCGGSGIWLTRAAAAVLRPVLGKCIEKHLHPAGDVRLGACITSDAPGITMVRRREFVKDSVLRAVGELELQHYFAFPAAFHRARNAALFEHLHLAQARRGRWGLVTWPDLLAVFPPDGGSGFARFDFFPNSYANCSDEFGVKATPKPYNPKIKWGQRGLPPLPPPKPDALPGEWAGCDKLVGKRMP